MLTPLKVINALLNLTTGVNNTAVGADTLFSNTQGSANTATGAKPLDSNTTGYNNTATGASALSSNATGFSSWLLDVEIARESDSLVSEAAYENTQANHRLFERKQSRL